MWTLGTVLLLIKLNVLYADGQSNDAQKLVQQEPSAVNVNDVFHDEEALRKTAERSLLKGKKDYSELKQRIDQHQDQLQPISEDALPPPVQEIQFGEEEETVLRALSKGKPVYSEPVPAGSLTNSTNGMVPVIPKPIAKPVPEGDLPLARVAQQLAKYGDQVNDQSLGRRIYNRVRVTQCVGWCKQTLPPYTDLAKAVCRSNGSNATECVKPPGKEAECKQKCEAIIRDLPDRPFFTCPLYCEIAYGGLQKTLEYCKSQCR